MKWKVAAVVLLLAVGLGTVGYVLFAPGGNGSGASAYLTAAVTRGNVTQQVVATGTVQSAATYELAFGSDPVLSTSSSSTPATSSTSWLVKDVSVGVGDRVAKGDVLATADTASAKAALDLAKANLAVAKARLAVDKAGLTGAERAAAYDSIRQAQQQLTVAKQSQVQTADQNELKLSQAKTALANAQQQLADDQAAGPSDTTIKADQAAIDQAQQQLDTLNLQISGTSSTDSITSQQNQLKLQQAQAALASAQQKLVTDSTASPAPDSSVLVADQTAINQAQQSLDTLNLQIQAANAQSSTSNQQNQLKLAQAQAALAKAQQQLADDQAAGPSTTTIKADQSAIDNAQQQLDTLELSITSSGTSAANQLTSAQLSLSSSQHNYSTKVAPADASTIATDKASVASATTSVNDAKDTLDHSTLVSPVDGVVTAVGIVTGATAPGSADLTVASLQMEVSATVTETDYPSLKVGQAVTVSITALDKTATGTVKEIDPTGTSSGTGGVVSYPVIVSIDPVPDGTASGMSADIEVVTAEASDVLSVPATALTGRDGNYAVRVLGADGAPTSTAVEVGLVTSSMAEIKSGLTEGQTVVTGTSTAQTGAAATTGGGGLVGGGLGFPTGGGGNFRPRTEIDVLEAIISLDHVSRVYAMGHLEVPALLDVSLQVHPGEFLAIVGPSGSGKTTMMNILGCLDRPTGGQYTLAGTPVSELDDDGLAKLRSRTIGFVFQSYNLLPRTSALDNVATPLLYQGVSRRERAERAKVALERLGLGDRLHHEPSELSGGQQQRVAVARALVTEPALILADEPTGNLDSHSGAEVLALFHELNAAGRTIVLITHDSDVAVAASRQVHLRDGQVVA